MGAGIIGLPYALKECGYVVGVVLLILVAGITHYSNQLIIGNLQQCMLCQLFYSLERHWSIRTRYL